MFAPSFSITTATAKALIGIEVDRQAIIELPIDFEMLSSLRETARLVATHYSTQIEGNRLTQAQVKESLNGARFPGRERDVREVRNYYRALEEIERLAQTSAPITGQDIRIIHGLVMEGSPSPTPYRDGQNVIRDSASGGIVYMPPEARDVPKLMADLEAWIVVQLDADNLPVPVIAALAHYQFATIHPYYDGNGRTARLLTTLILHKNGYGLKGIYNLEEYYAADLSAYYRALDVGFSHNYYFGRAEADLSAFIEYFCNGMSASFSAVRSQVVKAAVRGSKDVTDQIRRLDPRQRRILDLFRRQSTAVTAEIADHLGISVRTALIVCRDWVKNGFAEVHDTSRKARSYKLSAEYEDLIRGL